MQSGQICQATPSPLKSMASKLQLLDEHQRHVPMGHGRSGKEHEGTTT
jgi:hypothetical protein